VLKETNVVPWFAVPSISPVDKKFVLNALRLVPSPMMIPVERNVVLNETKTTGTVGTLIDPVDN
jgi:hypothetical protein